MFNKVFISYAREDFEYAKDIYEHLELNNFKPWMDKKKLLVGQKWEIQIMNELRLSDFIIILLSKTSVAKRGFVQREFKYALKYAEEKLNTDIYILPIKIDDCDVPEELAVFNWTEFENYDTNRSIIESLNTQRNLRINNLPKELINLKNFTENKVVLEGEINKLISYDIKYPLFNNTSDVNVEMLNTEILHYVNTQLSKFYNDFFRESDGDLTQLRYSEEEKHIFEVSFSIGILNNKIISILFHEYIDFHGAHPNQSWTSINVAFNPNRILDISCFSNLDRLKDLMIKYKYDFEETETKETENNISDFNKIYCIDNSNDHFHPKTFEFLLLEDKVLINFSNYLPHAAQALGQFEFKYKLNKGLIEFTE